MPDISTIARKSKLVQFQKCVHNCGTTLQSQYFNHHYKFKLKKYTTGAVLAESINNAPIVVLNQFSALQTNVSEAKTKRKVNNL